MSEGPYSVVKIADGWWGVSDGEGWLVKRKCPSEAFAKEVAACLNAVDKMALKPVVSQPIDCVVK